MGMSTQSASPFSEHLSWDVPHNCDFEEEIADNDILTALVRSSYLKHLHRSLMKNYDLWFEKNPNNEDFSEISQNDIMNCANFLEFKALRACMVTSIYQKVMVTTMKEIKRSTEEGSLFSPLLEQIFDNKGADRTKSNNQCDKETQTNISLLPANSNTDQEDKTKNNFQPPVDEHSLDNANLIVIKPHNEPTKDHENQDDIESLFNILMHSPSCSESETFRSPKKRKYSQDSITFLTSESNHSQDETPPILNGEMERNLHFIDTMSPITKNNTINNSLPSFPPEPMESTSSYSKTENSDVSHKTSNLDERLKSLAALFGEDSPAAEEPVANSTVLSEQNTSDLNLDCSDQRTTQIVTKPFILPHDWRTEYAAHNCNLKMFLSRLTSARRHELEKRFRELFGPGRSHHTRISFNEEVLSRKRTANIVVGELTPLFISGRIASREVFKSLAKKITDNLLLLPHVPESEEISSRVNSVFENGKCIYSERDINEICF